MKVARDFKEAGYCALALAITKNLYTIGALKKIDNYDKDREEESYLLYILKRKEGYTYDELARMFSMGRRTVLRRINKYEENYQ